MDVLTILQTKRYDLRPHTKEELQWWISEYSKGGIPEYQMSAWLMAVCWRGMTMEETALLTRCMVDSGATLDWKDVLPTNLVDKHSTGGVGDKVSLILAPLVACLGVSVPMMAGRGLGHTGGTIDKLESIPGYQTGLSITEFQRVVQEIGCSIVSASKDMCLADRKLYALRDVTATVSSVPLQTASIMCKKIAEHPRSLVLDCKYGKASFQSSIDGAIELAHSMIATSEANGLCPTTCLLTHMDSFIGTSVGNWLEVLECLDMLKGNGGSPDLVALVVIEAAQMLQQSEKYSGQSLDHLIQLCLDTLQSGKAYPKFESMVKAQGGNVTVCQDPSSYPLVAKYSREIKASTSGFIREINGTQVGNLAVQLGAGRLVADEPVDAMSGFVFQRREGDHVNEGDIIAKVYTNKSQEALDHACETLKNAIVYSETPVEVPFVISHMVTSKDGVLDFSVPKCLEELFK
jgi:pyrimidine-nucleoside phosphorylase